MVESKRLEEEQSDKMESKCKDQIFLLSDPGTDETANTIVFRQVTTEILHLKFANRS